jgi:hypothetical protein
MWPRYIQVSFNFAGTGWISQHVFLQSCICLQITILRHPVVTSEIQSYLQNSNSTFFLIYAYDFRQHTTSPPFTYASLIKTQPNHTILHAISTLLPESHTQIINDKIGNSLILVGQPIHGTITHGSVLIIRKSMLIHGNADTCAAIHWRNARGT